MAGLAAAFARPEPGHRHLKLKAAGPPHSLLAFRHTRGGSVHLVRVGARMLRPLRGPRMTVAGHSFGWSFSPDESLLALGDDGGGEVWLVDTRRLRLAGRVSADDYGHVLATAWLGGRLLAVVNRCRYSDEPREEEGLALAVVDPAAQRRISRQVLDGSLQGVARKRLALALLLGPRFSLGPSRLVVADAEGRMRSAPLERILSGRQFAGRPAARSATPGLTLGVAGNRAFVLGPGGPLAEVDLATLAVAYHELSTPISMLGRLHDRLEPAAEAKTPLEGPIRGARWLGDGFLAVWGHDTHVPQDERGYARMRETPAGVKLIDTRDWSVRTLDPDASRLVVADGKLLTYGRLWDSARRRESGTGLSAYGSDGGRRFHLFGSTPITAVQVVGGRAFVRKLGPRNAYSVVDLQTGRVERTVRGELPELLR